MVQAVESLNVSAILRLEAEGVRPALPSGAILDEIAKVEGVVKVVAFPDCHQKPSKEVPSSLAVATTDTYVPNFSSVNQNCGMCYLQTDLASDQLDKKALDRLVDLFRRHVPVENADSRIVLKREEVERTILEGAAYACDRYDLEEGSLRRMEKLGNELTEADGDPSRLLKLIPDSVYEVGQREFGHLGGGNHFIEIQKVSQVIDRQACEAYGLSPDRILVLYHTDSLSFGGHIGFFYGSRHVSYWKHRIALAGQKLVFHGPRLMRSEWWKAVFGRQSFNPVHVETPVGRTLLAANHLNANFGYANRASIGKWLIDAIAEFDPYSKGRLFVDSNHNSITRETIDGRSLFVHRHNAVRVQPPEHLPADSPFRSYGAPIILPGFNDTSSFLAVPGPEAAHTLYSADHGGAKLMERMDSLGDGPSRVTWKYSYTKSEVVEAPHRGDRGIETLIRTLDEAKIIKPIARMTPLAVLKI
jgi:RNA-splicing ligase RtcB